MQQPVAPHRPAPSRVAPTQVLRVGGIDYLNALPLTAYLEPGSDPRLELTHLVPSALADSLRTGDLDIALAPVVEYLASDRYRVLPGMCISSYGAVESIRLYCSRPLAEVRRVGLDVCSRTSALLTRLLFRRRYGAEPEFETIDPVRAGQILASAPADGDMPDAVLLIGDAALERPAVGQWRVYDLGNEWTRWTGLPFVYAFWVWRGERSLPGGVLERFRRGKAVGISRIDDIVRGHAEPRSVEERQCRDYLSRVIQYDLGSAQQEGLHRFFTLLAEEGLTGAESPVIRYARE